MNSSKPSLENLFPALSLASQDLPAPALYVVGLPIGNMADASLRALWVLNNVNAIAAEDTRETKKILEKFNIHTPLFPVHQHNEHEGAEKILTLLREEKRVAIVTDAGTPAISDPGSKTVDTISKAGFRIIPIPGANAAVTAMSAAGMAPEGFIFHGFLHGGSRERISMLNELTATGRTFILYEAPHRMVKLAEELSETVPPDRKIIIARELTKKFESIKSVSSANLNSWILENPPKGEYVIIVNADICKKNNELSNELKKWLDNLHNELPTGQLATIASKITGFSKKAIYDYILNKKTENI